MKESDFTYSTKQIRGVLLECLLTHIERKMTYGIIIQANGTPPNSWIFEQFMARGKEFFIDVECITTVVPVEEPQPVAVLVETPTTGSV